MKFDILLHIFARQTLQILHKQSTQNAQKDCSTRRRDHVTRLGQTIVCMAGWCIDGYLWQRYVYRQIHPIPKQTVTDTCDMVTPTQK